LLLWWNDREVLTVGSAAPAAFPRAALSGFKRCYPRPESQKTAAIAGTCEWARRVIALNDAPIGRLITDGSRGWFHIVHIALPPEWRNRGISTVLMTSVLDEPRRRRTRCQATVALDNLASLRLRSRLGFTLRERGDTDLILEWRPS
jgi:RimJ/RimL family protein N-acetyltransferase